MDHRGIKHKRVRYQRAVIGWLMLATMLFLLGVGLAGISTFPDPCAMPVFYPLLLLVRYAPAQQIVWGGMVLIAALLLLLAWRKRVKSTTIAALVLVGGSLMLYAWTESQWLPQIHAIKTYPEEGILYRLVYISNEGTPLTEELSPVRTFVLLACGGLGSSLCHTVGTADMTLGGMGGFQSSDVAEAHLYYLYEDYADETNRMLTLQLGDGVTWEYVHTFIGCGVI